MMTAKEILKKIEEIRMNGACFGIRCTDETHEIGDELENSYNWNEFDEEHGGEYGDDEQEVIFPAPEVVAVIR